MMEIRTTNSREARLKTNYTPSKIKLYIAHRLIDKEISKASKKGQQQCQIRCLPFLFKYDKVKFLYLNENVEKRVDKHSLELETDNIFLNYVMEEYIKLGYFVKLGSFSLFIGWGTNGIDLNSVYLKNRH
ncbi:MAG: hypothetical protein Q4D26_11495 [Clostridia bacterium]|nr:hypothetical protein [Clostridia bacterium]